MGVGYDGTARHYGGYGFGPVGKSLSFRRGLENIKSYLQLSLK